MIPRKTLSLKRYGVGSVTKGQYTKGSETISSFTASVQPMSAKEMLLLPEGRRESESFRLYTDTKLHPSDENADTAADVVVIDGNNYEVLSCATWQNNIINHYKAVVVKL